jgi:diguanylate cyclase (GGDEF)-like protein
MAVRQLFAAAVPARALDAGPGDPEAPRSETLVQSYRQLADVFHDILSEQSLDNLLERVADTLAELVPHDTLSIYQADEAQTVLIPVLARDKWAEKILNSRSQFGEGITGWAALHREPVRTNQAHLDPRTKTVPGTPDDEPEALITVPLIARDVVKGVLNIYRLGEDASFSDEEFELTTRFADAAALALDNAQIRERLEYQAQTDSLTGLYNHRYFHERLRAELTRASRARDSVAVLMLDIDDFKRVNDVYGHGAGDQVLTELADLLRGALRGSDVVCRLGGEEFGVIMAGGDAGDAVNLARRLTDTLAEFEFGPAGKMTISVGISEGPQHAMNPRELVACSEAAMMTAKARGKNQIVLFEEHTTERPDGLPATGRDVRSIAHLKMLQSLAGKLNRLNDVRRIGAVIADELRLLIDYHNCRVSVIEGDEIVPIAFRGELVSRDGEHVDLPRTKIGEGITGRAAATAEPQLVGNTLECAYAVMIPGTHTIEESLVAVPLCYGARVIGVIVMSKLGVDQFDREDVRLLEVLAGHASVALENARLYEAQRREADHLKSLLEFTGGISQATTPEEIGRETVQAASQMLGGKDCALWLPSEEGGYRISAHTDYDATPALRPMLEIVLPDDLVKRVVGGRNEPFLIEAAEAESHMRPPAGLSWPDLAAAPLWNDDFLGGFITVREPCGGEHSLEEVLRLLAGIAYQAAVALERARSFESLENTFVSTVEALANALEANDEYTSSHTRWITDMALKVGAALGFDAAALKRLELGALFHDIGKIGIPTSILLKPGPLTSEERAIIEMHPELGERILEPIDRLADVRKIVRSCHERWDGAGYPDRKAGEEIPVEARIVLVCDAFHAMTTDRPYRKRLSLEEAYHRLREGAGSQFDPAVVEVFVSLPCEAPVPVEHAEAEAERLAS